MEQNFTSLQSVALDVICINSRVLELHITPFTAFTTFVRVLFLIFGKNRNQQTTK